MVHTQHCDGLAQLALQTGMTRQAGTHSDKSTQAGTCRDQRKQCWIMLPQDGSVLAPELLGITGSMAEVLGCQQQHKRQHRSHLQFSLTACLLQSCICRSFSSADAACKHTAPNKSTDHQACHLPLLVLWFEHPAHCIPHASIAFLPLWPLLSAAGSPCPAPPPAGQAQHRLSCWSISTAPQHQPVVHCPALRTCFTSWATFCLSSGHSSFKVHVEKTCMHHHHHVEALDAWRHNNTAHGRVRG